MQTKLVFMQIGKAHPVPAPIIRAAMKRNGSPRARFKADDLRLWFVVELPIHPALAEDAARKATENAGTKLGLSRDQVAVLHQCRADSGMVHLLEIAGRTNRTKFRQQVLNPLLDAGLIEMTIPDKPRSSLQRYRTTAAGRAALAARKTKS